MRDTLPMKKAAFAYLRVSGKGQLEGDGFTRQLAAIKKHAATKVSGLFAFSVRKASAVPKTSKIVQPFSSCSLHSTATAFDWCWSKSWIALLVT